MTEHFGWRLKAYRFTQLRTPSGTVSQIYYTLINIITMHNNNTETRLQSIVHAMITKHQRGQFASVRSWETLDTNIGLVANTLIGKSQTIVSTSMLAGPCQRAPLSAELAAGGASFGSGVFAVTNSKCSRHRRDTEQNVYTTCQTQRVLIIMHDVLVMLWGMAGWKKLKKLQFLSVPSALCRHHWLHCSTNEDRVRGDSFCVAGPTISELSSESLRSADSTSSFKRHRKSTLFNFTL